jgi:hypothetical protein
LSNSTLDCFELPDLGGSLGRARRQRLQRELSLRDSGRPFGSRRGGWASPSHDLAACIRRAARGGS